MMTKRILIGAGAVAVAVGSLSAWAGYTASASSEVQESPTLYAMASPSAEDVMARVNGKAVTRGDVDREIEAFLGDQLAALPATQQAGVRDQLAGKVLEDLIVQKLLSEAVDQQKVSVDPSEITGAMEKIQASLPPGKTMQDVASAAGISNENLQKQLESQLRVNKLLEQKAASVSQPTEEEILAFYNEKPELFEAPETVEARHILIASAPTDGADAKMEKRKQAESIRAELVNDNGASFTEKAAQVSDCPSKTEGGNLGPFAKGDSVPAFETAAFSQKVDEIGPVVETEFGYHIIQVQKRTEAGKVSFADAKDAIAKQLGEDKKRAAVESYIGSLKASASIEYPQAEAA